MRESIASFPQSSYIGSAQAFQSATAFHAQGRLRQAEKLYDAVLAADPRHFGAVYALGLLRVQQGRFTEAEPLFRRAVGLDGHSAEAHHHLAIALIGMRRPAEAIRPCEAALALQPDYAEAHNDLGYALQMIERHAEAVRHYEKAVALNPCFAQARNNLGNALLTLGRTGEALAQFQRAVAIQPDYAQARQNFAQALAALRFDPSQPPEKARGFVAPNDAKLLVTLGNVYWQRCEGELAARAFRAAEALAPNCTQATFGLAIMLNRIDRDAEAAALFERLIEQGTARVKALVLLAHLPISPQRIDLVSELEQAIENIISDEQRVGIAFALACALDKAGRHAEAWQHLVPANRARFAELKAELGTSIDRQRANLESVRAHPGNTLCRVAANETPTSLFILGPGRSGKSTMEKLVGTLDHVKRGFEDPSVVNALDRTLRAGGVPTDGFVDWLPVELHSSFRNNYREELVQRAGSAKVFTNTNPALIHRALLLAVTCPKVRFLFMKRNLEDNALRIYMKDLRLNPQTYDLWATADYIIWYQQMVDLLAQKLPDIVRIMHYENMIANPAGSLQTVADWLGLRMPERSIPSLGDDRGCARPYRALMAAALET